MGKRGIKPGTRRKGKSRVYMGDDKKRCTKCLKWKPLSDFYMRQEKSTPDSLPVFTPACRECDKRLVVRRSWKKKLEQGGDNSLVEHIGHLEAQLQECRMILERFQQGQDVVNW